MLDRYRQAFSKLRTDVSRARWSARTCHRAPHKPLLLLSVMDLLAQGSITSNLIELDPELGGLFALHWAQVLPPGRAGRVPGAHWARPQRSLLVPGPGPAQRAARRRKGEVIAARLGGQQGAGGKPSAAGAVVVASGYC